MIGAVAFLAMAAWLRHLPFSSEPILYSYLQIVGSLLCFTYAANALVRFRGTHDRLTLILAFGFVLSGAIETAATFNFYGILASGAFNQSHVPLAWMVSRTLLALVLIAALVVEQRVPNSREPGREIAVALLVVVGVAYATSAAYFGAALEPVMHTRAFLSRPGDLLPALLFAVAAVGFARRSRNQSVLSVRPRHRHGAVDERGLPSAGNAIRAIAGRALHDGPILEGGQLRDRPGRSASGQRAIVRPSPPTCGDRSTDRPFELPHPNQCDGNGNPALPAHRAPIRHSAARSRQA